MIDYTKVVSGVQKGYDEGLRTYMLKVYNFMAMALLITGAAGYATLNFPPLANLMFNLGANGEFYGNSGLGTLIMLAPVGIAFYFFMGMGKMSISTAQTLFWVYAALTGMSLSSLGFIYTGTSIVKTFFICSSLFGAMSIYGYTTEKDLTSMGSFLIMGLIGILISSLINMFFRSPAIEFATSLIGIAVFTGLIAWDTQKIKSMYYSAGGGELGQKMSIVGAFNLYLDFINLFLQLIRFFGQRRDQ